MYFIIDWTTAATIIEAIFLMPWVSILLLFYGVLPAIRSQPKMIELLEDRIAIRFKSCKVFSLHFSEIESIRLFDRTQKKERALKYRLLDPFHRIADYSKFGFVMWLSEVVLGILPPFFFGFGSKRGEVLIRRKKGWNRLRLFFPWLNTSKRSRAISLTPSDPREYFQQLEVAYEKWKRAASSENKPR
jgi:hypothetical protein